MEDGHGVGVHSSRHSYPSFGTVVYVLEGMAHLFDRRADLLHTVWDLKTQSELLRERIDHRESTMERNDRYFRRCQCG